MGAWLCLHNLYITFERSIVISLTTFYLYKNTYFPIETIITNASKVRKPNRKPNYSSINEEKSKKNLFMNNIL
jgi:hypothetical protein